MVRTRTMQIATGLALMVSVGCQHHRQQECSCSCATPVQPAIATPPATPPAKPAVMNTMPTEPAVRTAVGNPI
jgi:hypothetical protein